MTHVLRWCLVVGVCLLLIPCVFAENNTTVTNATTSKLTSFEAPFPTIIEPDVQIAIPEKTPEFETITPPGVDITPKKADVTFSEINATNANFEIQKVKAEFPPIPAIKIEPLFFLNLGTA